MYKVLFRIEKIDLINKLKGKLRNLKKYMEDKEDKEENLLIEIVFACDVVEQF